MSLKSEFLDWKTNMITVAYFEAIHERIKDATAGLIESAGLDNAQDNFWRGFIHAYGEMLDFRVEDVKEGETE